MRSLPPTTSTLLALLNLLLTHPLPTHTHGHSVPTAAADADWATRHMAEEHHIANMDPPSFFTLHDFDSNGLWTPDEIRRTYGLDSTDDGGRRTDLSEEKKREVVAGVLGVFDADGDGAVSRAEFVEGWYGIARGGQQGGGGGGQGKRLPDFGTGPGHHGDDEYEYEIHHFEKFHDESTQSLPPFFSLPRGFAPRGHHPPPTPFPQLHEANEVIANK